MSNTTPSWATAISEIEGGLLSLGRVLLHRSALAAIPTAKGAIVGEGVDDEDEEEDEGARFFSPKKRRASTPRQGQIGAEDLLCLVLVILTASIMGSEKAVSRLAAIRELIVTGTLFQGVQLTIRPGNGMSYFQGMPADMQMRRCRGITGPSGPHLPRPNQQRNGEFPESYRYEQS